MIDNNWINRNNNFLVLSNIFHLLGQFLRKSLHFFHLEVQKLKEGMLTVPIEMYIITKQ